MNINNYYFTDKYGKIMKKKSNKLYLNYVVDQFTKFDKKIFNKTGKKVYENKSGICAVLMYVKTYDDGL